MTLTDSTTVQEPQALNLHQKIAGMIGEVHMAKPAPSGKNQFGVEAFSIGDIEALVAPLLATYRVTVEPSMSDLQPIEKSLWRVAVDFIVRDADNPEDMFSGQMLDIGGNPAAAVSFATKGYLKRLFHIADYEEEGHPEFRRSFGGSGQRTAVSQKVDAPPMPDGREATPSEPVPPKGRNVISLKRPAVDPDQRAECLHLAVELAKAGRVSGAPIEDEAEAMGTARRYLDAMARKNYQTDFLGCTTVQVAGIQSLIASKLVRSKT